MADLKLHRVPFSGLAYVLAESKDGAEGWLRDWLDASASLSVEAAAELNAGRPPEGTWGDCLPFVAADQPFGEENDLTVAQIIAEEGGHA